MGTQATAALPPAPKPSSVEIQGGMNRNGLEPDPSGIYLDSKDPFEAACIEMVQMNRKKRADYAVDGDPFSNFHTTSAMMGISSFGPVEAVLFNLSQKFARLNALRKNGRMDETQNEAVYDTYLDIAVYGTILFAMVKSFK